MSNVTEEAPYWKRKRLLCRLELHKWGESKRDYFFRTPRSSMGFVGDPVQIKVEKSECVSCGAIKQSEEPI